MAKCTVTLNVALLGRPYTGKSIRISDVVGRDDGTYWVTTELASIPLTNSPLATIELDQGAPYFFALPDGSTSIRRVRAGWAAANFTQLEVLQQSPAAPSTLVVEAFTHMLLSSEPLPTDAVAGQTYFETDTNIFGQIGA
ncbi:MAG: hypothetical protein ABWX92_07575 [Mycetocola sp.]